MLRSLPIRYLATLGRRFFTSDSKNYRHGAVISQSPSRKPSRSGQNLSDRYVRLERSLRAKESFSKQLEETGNPSVRSTGRLKRGTNIEMFRGFELPEEPKPPGDSDCCMSGCAVCVYDLYEESIEHYKRSVSALRAALSSLNIPESEWPHRIQTKGPLSPEGAQERKNTILTAFEEMERKLAAKHAEEGASQS
ncbi:hypothetical protein M413DRAFT_70672 [Hebeloma cylindrosporum]|uniref:Oxidoreductase-like domain-containing protein n=1 Tax=Hebeloma cylindrosporum TaxID=76867 RepID=A0A0C2YN88_HEBCY|nr:hypothetical protein M413DRAFT_70672 [Hebeloma cylindrosporum h7]